MPFKFEKLEVWTLSLEYLDRIYAIAEKLPASENFNLRSQITRAATSISLAIAEGSTGQTDTEQARFLGIAIRSAMETVACLHIIRRRKLGVDPEALSTAYVQAQFLVGKLSAMRRTLDPDKKYVREEAATYETEDG